jgi:thioredoxin reductase
MRVVVIGAGPVGLAAALGAVARGWDVHVLERECVGASLRRWGASRFFSPLAMNVPPTFGEVIALPPGDAILTGPEFAAAVLEPIAGSARLAGRVLERHAVTAVLRSGMGRGELAGHPIRGERSFRILVDTPAGERELEADAVLDASGVGLAVRLGARGERAAESRIVRSLGELAERRSELAGRRVLLVGYGHSAANALQVLAAIAVEAPDTRIVWAVRAPNLRPVVDVASDPLPERRRVVACANEVAARPPAWLRVERRANVLALEVVGEVVRATLSGDRTVEVDRVIAMIGARPDHSITSELALDLSPSTEGSGGIARRLANVTDCLAVPRLAAEDLASGEPRFHFVGVKSYGRARTFLLQTGYAQLATVLAGLAAT